MSFSQRLAPEFFERLHHDIRTRMAEKGIGLLILDAADDVLYTTGFSFRPNERPVALALTATDAILLIPSWNANMPAGRTWRRKRWSISNFRASIAPSRCWPAWLGPSRAISPIPSVFRSEGRPSLPDFSRTTVSRRPISSRRCERTFVLGEPSKDHGKFYTIAQEAQRLGTAGLVAGRTCASADITALTYIREQGMTPYPKHRIGHGMGVAFHESPWVEAGDQTVLRQGMICSSEPALYVPEVGGFRLADTVLVTEQGPDSLTKFPSRFEEIVLS